MLSYEFRKLQGSRAVLTIVALLLLLNIGHTFLTCRDADPGAVIEQVRKQNAEDPEGLDASYAELQELDQQGFQQMIAASKAGEEDYVWTLPMTFDPQGRLDDLRILKKVYVFHKIFIHILHRLPKCVIIIPNDSFYEQPSLGLLRTH